MAESIVVSKIDHLAFRVSDIDKTQAFMEKLGYTVKRRTTHHGAALEMTSPLQPDIVIEFTALVAEKNEVPGFDHACFRIEDEDEFNDLAEAGFPVKNKPYMVPGSDRRVSSFRDHDDVKWQIVIN